MPITNSQEKFAHELADIYDAEHQFLEALRTMKAKASDPKLKSMLEEHADQTQQQISRLKLVFSETGTEPQRQTCSGAKGLVEEATKMMEETMSPELRDTVIAGAATKAEHYEMVSYKDLIEGASQLKLRRAAKLLTENRDEEVRTARRLERVAPRLDKAAA